MDDIPLDFADSYIHLYDVQMTPNGKIKASSRRKLAKTGMHHHIIGKTY